MLDYLAPSLECNTDADEDEDIATGKDKGEGVPLF
jgi:hypothetical protein